MVLKKTAALLRSLADKYETSDFLRDDPSQFMHRFGDSLDQELFAFVAAQLAFGKRELFIAKLNALHDAVIASKPKTAATSLAQTKNASKPKTWIDRVHRRHYRANLVHRLLLGGGHAEVVEVHADDVGVLQRHHCDLHGGLELLAMRRRAPHLRHVAKLVQLGVGQAVVDAVLEALLVPVGEILAQQALKAFCSL